VRRRTDRTDVPHGPTSCTLRTTLSNGSPTLYYRGPTDLTVRLTTLLVELTLPQSAGPASADDGTRGISGITARGTRLTLSGTAITHHAESPTALRKRFTSCARCNTRGSWTVHAPTAAVYSLPPLGHESLLDDHDPRAAIHARLVQPYGLSPFAHAWYDDSHIIGSCVHAVRA